MYYLVKILPDMTKNVIGPADLLLHNTDRPETSLIGQGRSRNDRLLLQTSSIINFRTKSLWGALIGVHARGASIRVPRVPLERLYSQVFGTVFRSQIHRVFLPQSVMEYSSNIRGKYVNRENSNRKNSNRSYCCRENSNREN